MVFYATVHSHTFASNEVACSLFDRACLLSVIEGSDICDAVL